MGCRDGGLVWPLSGQAQNGVGWGGLRLGRIVTAGMGCAALRLPVSGRHAMPGFPTAALQSGVKSRIRGHPESKKHHFELSPDKS